MDRIDFRSDTVTWPTPKMREAMASAPVGDDVYGEDPTVNALEDLAADMMGKEAGLFVASGTMGNLVGILSQANRGDEAIVGVDAHTYRSEAGGMATIGGIVPRPLPTDCIGRMNLEEVVSAIRPDNPHYPQSRLILVENSYGSRCGYPISPDYFARIRDVANEHGLAVHLDGARIFNAAVALKTDACTITQYVDSVSFCLSKGLAAPVGSLLCGSSELIHRARRMRKSLGGGMRQAGVLAAAGIVALREMVVRLDEDHQHARLLAQGLAQISGISIDLDMVRTNMVFFGLQEDVSLSIPGLVMAMREEAGIWLGTSAPDSIRAVTHCWIGSKEVEIFLDAITRIMHGV